MKNTLFTLAILCMATFYSFGQEQKSAEELATEMVNKMELQLKIEPHQAFYVDSVLTHDYGQWMDEIDKLRLSGVQEPTVYLSVKKKWDAHIDSTLATILTPEQFIEYQKMTGKYKKTKKEKK